MAADLGGSAAAASALVGTYSAGQLIGNIVMGRVSDKHGNDTAAALCVFVAKCLCLVFPLPSWLRLWLSSWT